MYLKVSSSASRVCVDCSVICVYLIDESLATIKISIDMTYSRDRDLLFHSKLLRNGTPNIIRQEPHSPTSASD